MKKIIATLSLVLAFSVSANAQDNKVAVSGSEKSKQEATELKESLGLNEGLAADLYTLLEMKREILENPEASLERKQEMARIVGLKIQASLDATQLEKFIKNEALYRKVTGETAISESKK